MSEQPDFPTAAEAWFVQEATLAAMAYRARMIALGLEYAKRLEAELSAPLPDGKETTK